MKIQFKLLSIFMLFSALTFFACDTEEKTTIIPIGVGGAHNSAGDLIAYAADGVSFLMAYVPGGRFPTGVGTQTSPDDDGANPQEVSVPYWIGETEVTYELWYKVRTWAVTDAGGGLRADGGPLYTFSNPGMEGNDGTAGAAPTAADREPVTQINWRDAMVWCNALTEWYNWYNAQKGTIYSCVYVYDSSCTTPIRDAVDNDSHSTEMGGDYTYAVNPNAGGFDSPYVNPDAKGFRLLTSNEWECAARYIDGVTWTPGTYASGATADYTNDAATFAVSVFGYYSDSDPTGVGSTANVKSKRADALGLYDMSGNVYEWCFDWHPDYVGSDRVIGGGCWNGNAVLLQVGSLESYSPYDAGYYTGFRFARTE